MPGGCRTRSHTAGCGGYRTFNALLVAWAEGEGAAKLQWGVPGDFNRCRVELSKYVGPKVVDGLCSNLHKRATGFWPGRAPSEQKPGDHKGNKGHK